MGLSHSKDKTKTKPSGYSDNNIACEIPKILYQTTPLKLGTTYEYNFLLNSKIVSFGKKW